MAYSVRQIAALLTEDPNILNELGPGGGIHPGGQNEPGYYPVGEDEENGYQGIMVERLSQKTKSLLAPWFGRNVDARMFDQYAPIPVVLKSGKPYAAWNGTEWRDSKDREIKPEAAGMWNLILDAIGFSEEYFAGEEKDHPDANADRDVYGGATNDEYEPAKREYNPEAGQDPPETDYGEDDYDRGPAEDDEEDDY